MTNYADMPAGPEMDRLVAKNVLGWVQDEDVPLWVPPAPDERRNWGACWVDGWPDWLPEYSTDFSSAWVVLEKMRAMFASVSVSWDKNGCSCSLIAGDGSIFENAPSAPLAICRAALIAMESK
jgi:hypothetical protein